MISLKKHLTLQTIFSKISILFLGSAIIYLLCLFYIVFPKIDKILIDSQKEYIHLELDKINDLIYMFTSHMKEEKEAINNKKRELLEQNQIEKFKKYVQKRKIKENGYFLIIENNKNYIHPNKKYNNQTIDYFKKYNGVELLPLLKKHSKENRPFEHLWTKGDDYTTLYKKITWVHYNSYLNWYILASAYKEDLYKEPNSIKNTILKISLIIIVILYILFSILAKRIVKPLRNLTYNIKGLKKNNKEYPIIFSNDEVGTLSKEFSFMREKINNNIQDLENTIEHRTAELQNKLFYDEITNLKNRNSLVIDIQDKKNISIILVDINRFSVINEFYGYKTGNYILKEFTKFLNIFAKNNRYTLYRLEGVTFAFVKTDCLKVKQYYNDIMKFFKELDFHAIYIPETEDNFYVHTTLGISINEKRPLKTAYSALNKAKRANESYIIYNPEINDNALIENNILWSKKIKQAILENSITPFYQPIMNKDNKILKYEVLMRIEDRENKKFISPFYFLDISKKTKQYNELSAIIISKSLDKLNSCDINLSINLNFKDITNPIILNLFDSKIKSKSTGERLTVEILEDIDIEDYDILDAFIEKYRKKGILFAIDDFGTGYSNFENILNIKPDFIKIDGSLIKNIHNDKVSYKLVKSIVKFSKEMDIDVIAEFVHSKEVFEKLKNLDIYGYQGYYLGEPSKL